MFSKYYIVFHFDILIFSKSLLNGQVRRARLPSRARDRAGGGHRRRDTRRACARRGPAGARGRAAPALVERFDIEPFSDFLAK